MSQQRFYIPNRNPKFWHKKRPEYNCGAFALNTPSWVAPFDNDDHYTEEARQNLIKEMMDEGFDRKTIMETVMIMDQESLLAACPWIEPVLPEEIRPEDRIVAYRLCLDEDAFEAGEIDDDYHFRVRINGFWFEKCGRDPIRFCGLKADEEPWRTTPYLLYDSEVKYFRFKV